MGGTKLRVFRGASGPLSSHPFLLILPQSFPFRPCHLSYCISPLHLHLYPSCFDSRKTLIRYPSDLGTLRCPVPLYFLPSPYGNASLNIVLTNGTDMQYEVAWCHTCSPPCSLFQSVPSEQIPNPSFLALLAFLAFFLL